MKERTAAAYPRLARFVRPLITMLMLAAAIWAGLRLWDHYELAPWTRDGRVRANVVQIAPDVSGLVTAVPIQDNQAVAAGTLLFEVDRSRYTLARHEAEGALAAQRAALAAQQTMLMQAQREDARNAALGTLVSQEAREQTRARVEQAQAGVAQAQAALMQAKVALESAELNLVRAEVHAPADGLVTNLDLRQGSYATAGHPVLALVDAHSFYVEGYFEETKLPRIHVG
ncbi:MAG TPA: biotin/lipoyl-binding protein, partial [Burkholderiaceae bacterium]